MLYKREPTSGYNCIRIFFITVINLTVTQLKMWQILSVTLLFGIAMSARPQHAKERHLNDAICKFIPGLFHEPLGCATKGENMAQN